MAFQRSHFYMPVTSTEGDLLTYVQATFIDPDTGMPTTAALYGSSDPTAPPLDNPAIFLPGVIEVWSDDPMRLDMSITGAGYSATITGVDLSPAPDDMPRTVALVNITNGVDSGKVLFTDGVNSWWAYPTFIAPHYHQGAQPHSVILDAAGASDVSPEQTWVGYTSQTQAPDQTASSGMGGNVDPAAADVTVFGFGTMTESVGVNSDRATVVGSGSSAAGDSLTVGHNTGLASARSIGLGLDSDSVVRTYLDDATAHLRGVLTSTATGEELGQVLAKPATPAGVTKPLWIRQDALVSGGLALEGEVRLGVGNQPVGFYGAAGTTQAAVPPSTDATKAGTAADNLRLALRAYGVVT